MAEIIKYQEKYAKEVFELYSNYRDEEDFFKVMTYDEFYAHLFKNPFFKSEGTFVALENGKVVGFASSLVRDMDEGNPKASGYIHTFIVKKENRRQGIGSKLLEECEKYIKEHGRNSVRFVFLGQINWPWYIPNTSHHMHPGMPCVRMNSDFYIFLYHHHYFVNSIHEGFHLPLAQYDMPESVKQRIEENKKVGLTVGVYDPKIHQGVYEFADEIEADGNPGFANAIRNNLKREQPRPFIVAAHDGKVCGWTGAMYVESTGRGHLDGITVSPRERKSGLGKAIFCNLCNELKKMGAQYMTFFTGLDNPARYIYLGAGFRVAQSFADMKKELK